MHQTDQTYCRPCATRMLKAWKGWPHRDPVPWLPRMHEGSCEACGQIEEQLPSATISWFNYHSEFSTGLPDYWLLIADDVRTKWGYPYYADGRCSRCGGLVVISEMNYPNGTRELADNCASCGVRVRKRFETG